MWPIQLHLGAKMKENAVTAVSKKPLYQHVVIELKAALYIVCTDSLLVNQHVH